VKNPLPICYRQPGICYRRPGIHQAAVSTNRQQIVNPFPVIVNLTAPKSAVSSTIHRKSIEPFSESIEAFVKPTDNRPIFRRNRPMRPLQPLKKRLVQVAGCELVKISGVSSGISLQTGVLASVFPLALSRLSLRVLRPFAAIYFSFQLSQFQLFPL
jgi:hypothetical protein